MDLLLGIVIPVFSIILAGWASIHYGIMDKAAAKMMNNYVYYFAVPPMLFLATAKVSVGDVVRVDFLMAFFVATSAVMALTIAYFRFAKLGGGDVMDTLVMSLTTGWPNTIYMGVPIAYFLFGEQGTLPVVIATLSTNVVFILALAICSGMGKHESGRSKILAAFWNGFFKNPIMVAPVLGMLTSYFVISVPDALNNLLSMLAPSAAPVALFTLGMSLYGLSLKTNIFPVIWISVLKLVIHPVIAWGVVTMMDLEPFWAASVILMSALPTGSMVYVLAQQYDKRVELASSVILLTTASSLLTLAVIIPALNSYVN